MNFASVKNIATLVLVVGAVVALAFVGGALGDPNVLFGSWSLWAKQNEQGLTLGIGVLAALLVAYYVLVLVPQTKRISTPPAQMNVSFNAAFKSLNNEKIEEDFETYSGLVRNYGKPTFSGIRLNTPTGVYAAFFRLSPDRVPPFPDWGSQMVVLLSAGAMPAPYVVEENGSSASSRLQACESWENLLSRHKAGKLGDVWYEVFGSTSFRETITEYLSKPENEDIAKEVIPQLAPRFEQTQGGAPR